MIKNIIFDFGDIFINLDKAAPEREFKKLGLPAMTLAMQKWNDQYEKGLMTTGEFIKLYLDEFPELTALTFTQAWNSILLDFPPHRLNWISDLAKAKKYRLFLLSNTNDLHLEHVMRVMGADDFARFQNSFEYFHLSQHMKMRKPEPVIYERVLKENNLIARESLFIDDLMINTASAAGVGMHVWNLQVGKEEVTQLFEVQKSLF